MLVRIYGILGHKAYFPNSTMVYYKWLFLWILVISILAWRRPSKSIKTLITIFTFYSAVLFAINYSFELLTGFKHIAIQGRYLFPVIGAFYVLVVYFSSNIKNSILKYATVIYTVLLFLLGSPLFFLITLPVKYSIWFY